MSKMKKAFKEFWRDMVMAPTKWTIHHPIGFLVYVAVSILIAWIPMFLIGLFQTIKERRNENDEEENS